MIRVDFLMPDDSIRCYADPDLNKENSKVSVLGEFVAIRDEHGICGLFKNVLCVWYEADMNNDFREKK